MKVDHFLWKAVLDFPPAGQPRSPEAQPGDLGREKNDAKNGGIVLNSWLVVWNMFYFP